MKTEDSAPEAIGSNPYGYGLCIRLDDDQVEALGIKEPPAPGTVYRLVARAVAKSVTASVEEPGETTEPGEKADVYMELQITDMELTKDSGKSIAETLYGE